MLFSTDGLGMGLKRGGSVSAQHHRQTLQQLAGSAEQGPAASRGPPTSATPQKPPRQERDLSSFNWNKEIHMLKQ